MRICKREELLNIKHPVLYFIISEKTGSVINTLRLKTENNPVGDTKAWWYIPFSPDTFDTKDEPQVERHDLTKEQFEAGGLCWDLSLAELDRDYVYDYDYMVLEQSDVNAILQFIGKAVVKEPKPVLNGGIGFGSDFFNRTVTGKPVYTEPKPDTPPNDPDGPLAGLQIAYNFTKQLRPFKSFEEVKRLADKISTHRSNLTDWTRVHLIEHISRMHVVNGLNSKAQLAYLDYLLDTILDMGNVKDRETAIANAKVVGLALEVLYNNLPTNRYPEVSFEMVNYLLNYYKWFNGSFPEQHDVYREFKRIMASTSTVGLINCLFRFWIPLTRANLEGVYQAIVVIYKKSPRSCTMPRDELMLDFSRFVKDIIFHKDQPGLITHVLERIPEPNINTNESYRQCYKILTGESL